MIAFFKKYHKWISIVLTIFIILFALSGIILNHRKQLSNIDINRNYLPSEYDYKNWNNAAVAGAEQIGNDSILIYGNIGVWLTNLKTEYFIEYNDGFPNGVDNHKVSKVLLSKRFGLFAGTYFGLYKFNSPTNSWKKIDIPIVNDRIVDIIQKGDSLLVMSRSNIIIFTEANQPKIITLPKPSGYDNKVGLFKTLWVIHSGELYGLPGILVVDIVGIIFIFLSLSGIIYWLIPYNTRRLKRKKKPITLYIKIRRFSLKWHNKIGWITIVLLVLTTTTGMFLRPPLLAAIAYTKVKKIPHTKLDSQNPWFDKLRRVLYLEDTKTIIVATLDGIYSSDDNFKSPLKPLKNHPPISVMGVTAFEKINHNTLLVGSFEGLFSWNLSTGYVEDYITKGPVKQKKPGSPPLGDFLVTGFSKLFTIGDVFFDYNSGSSVIGVEKKFSEMPQIISKQPMSIWSVALEVHTARIYKFMFGDFYILFIPLAGILILFILISGFVVWWKKY